MEAVEVTRRLRSDIILWYDSPIKVGYVHKLSLDWRPQPRTTADFVWNLANFTGMYILHRRGDLIPKFIVL